MVDIQEQIALTTSSAEYDLQGASSNLSHYLKVKLFDNIMDPIQLKICRNICNPLTQNITAND